MATSSYFYVLAVRSKFMLLFFPFLKRWNYTRTEEQMSGGLHKYLPPRQDVNAPDLYIPIVFGLWTYCLLVGIALFISQTFKPEILYNTVSTSLGAWMLNTFVLKVLLWVLGISSAAPLLELASYAGYPFVAACMVLVSRLMLGRFFILSSMVCVLFVISLFSLDGGGALNNTLYIQGR